MSFSGRVRAGEVTPPNRGLPTAGESRSVEVRVDGVVGNGFALPSFSQFFVGLGKGFIRSSRFCVTNVWLLTSLCHAWNGEQTHPRAGGCSLGR